jgi:hypothetical protein
MGACFSTSSGTWELIGAWGAIRRNTIYIWFLGEFLKFMSYIYA